MKIIINLGQGSLEHGCSNVVVQLLRDRHCIRQFSGSLPPEPELAQLYSQWQQGYLAFYQEKDYRIGLLETEGIRYSAADFQQICQQIPQQLNFWLNSPEFAAIETALRTELSKEEAIQVIIAAADRQLQKLPWQLWKFVDDYPRAEIAFSSLNWQETQVFQRNRQQVRILAILGNSTGIEVEHDLDALKVLPDSELTVLTEPPLAELNEYLWQPAGWDILLFSGHSQSNLAAGYIYLNKTEKITIAQLKHSLSKAIAEGLQIAIFNSCDGIGLAAELADLSLPYTVVMGEPVPDKIARIFLRYFLMAFATGKTFSLAVKEARQKLAGWETEYICASWLPAIWQNPATEYLIWRDVSSKTKPPRSRPVASLGLISSLVAASLVMVCRSLGWLEPSELTAYDRLMRQRPGETVDPRILVVEVTEEDLNRDRYPLADSALVEAIDLLEEHQPTAIGLDIHRPEERDPSYLDLIARLEQKSHLFPVCAYGKTNVSYNLPQGLSTPKLRRQMGFNDLLLDRQIGSEPGGLNHRQMDYSSNSQVRRQLLAYNPSQPPASAKCLTPYSLSFQLSFEYLQQQGFTSLMLTPEQNWQLGSVTLQDLPAQFGAYQQLKERGNQIAINYRAGEPGKKITLSQLRAGKVNPEWIENKVVLLGYTSAVAQDYFDTPYGVMPGVWIHAHMTSQIISAVEDERPLIRALPQWGDWLWILGWSSLMALVLASLSQKPRYVSILAAIAMILILDRIFLLLLVEGAWLPYVPTLIALLIVACAVIIPWRGDRQYKSLIG